MKKIFTSLFAMSAVFCAAAQAPTMTPNPPSGSELPSKLEEITFSFSEEVTIKEFTLASGPLSQSTVSSVKADATSTSFKIQLEDEYWGLPQDGQISMRISCTNVTIAGDTIKNETGNPMVFYADYSVKAESSKASFLRVYPEENEVSASEMYGTGADFYFDGEVEMKSTEPALIIYTLTNGLEHWIGVPSDDIWADWDWWTNEFYLSVPIPEIEGVSASDVDSIIIVLSDIYAGGSEVTIPEVIYTSSAARKAKRTAKSNTASALQISSEASTVVVYDMMGNLVGNAIEPASIKELPKGLYVVDGRKILVK